MKNQVNTSEGNVQFIDATGKMINIHPQHVYAVFNVDTVSFVMVGIPKTSGLSILTSTAEDMLFNGEEYTFEELKTVIPEEFAEAGAQARCEIVDELPETGKTNTIYLVPKSEGEGYDEYIYLKDEERWELVGDTSIEMENYLKKVDFAAYSAATDLKIDAISGAVSDEASRAISAESALSDSIDALNLYVDEVSGITDTLDGDIDILEESLAQEASARTAADEALSGAISSVTEDVAALSGDVTAHTSNTDIHVTAADKTAWADKYTQAEVDGIVSGLNDSIDAVSGAVADESARAQSAETALHDEIENIDLSDYYTKAEVDDMSEVAAQAINELTINKLDATAYTPTDLSNYYQKSETSGATELSTAFAAKQNVLTAGENIVISGDVISAEAGNDVTELTQAEYDVLVQAGTVDPDVLYIITDAAPINLNNYYQKSETSSKTEIEDAISAEATARTAGDQAVSAAVDTALLGYINGAEYVSTAKTINFLHGSTVIDSIDATDFIKDGMVDNVVISGNSLVITFNTDAGKEAISIPLTSIFDPSNYYTKSQTSGATELSSAFSGITDRIGEDEEVTAAAFVALNDRIGSAETAINAKQNVLTAGENITISGDVISAEGGGSVTIDPTLDSGSTNAVENGAIWSATTYNKEVTLEFDNSSVHNSTNFPSGCTEVKVTVPNYHDEFVEFLHSNHSTLGYATITNSNGSITVIMGFTDASYSIVDGVVVITYPASKGVAIVRLSKNEGTTVKAVVEGVWVNENTYMSAEVDGKIKALDDKKLDATAYTPVVVDSQLNAVSTNPVQNQALYDELIIEGAEEETTLTFTGTYPNYKSTNYPSGCTKVKITSPSNSNIRYYFYPSRGGNVGYVQIFKYGSISVSLAFGGASYSIDGGDVIITYPTVTNVDYIAPDVADVSGITVKAITTQTTHLIDLVTANTASISGLTDRIGEDEEVTAAAFIALNDRVGSAETEINDKADISAVTAVQDSLSGYTTTGDTNTLSGSVTAHTSDSTIHVTSANKTSWDGAATNASTAITNLGGLKLQQISQSAYDSLTTKDASTLYVIVN